MAVRVIPGTLAMRKIASILVAADLTDASDEVLRAAAALAAVSDAKLHVLHAFDFQALPYSEEYIGRVTFGDRIDDAKRALEEQIRRTVRPGVVIASQEVVIYLAHKAIRARAEEVGADLIVLGPHRRRALGDAFLGSTADRVIRTASVPCLVIRGPLSLPLRSIVVPLDLSEPASAALDVALEWSDALRPLQDDVALGPRVTVLHVIPWMFPTDDSLFDRAEVRPELHREVDAALGRVDVSGALDVREEVCWGVPEEEILHAADRQQADLLVLATHGHGAVKRALIGSVASSVARKANRPVLLVPPTLWITERGTRSSGHGARRTIEDAMLPSRTRFEAPRPCVPRMNGPICSRAAHPLRASAGRSSHTTSVRMVTWAALPREARDSSACWLISR